MALGFAGLLTREALGSRYEGVTVMEQYRCTACSQPGHGGVCPRCGATNWVRITAGSASATSVSTVTASTLTVPLPANPSLPSGPVRGVDSTEPAPATEPLTPEQNSPVVPAARTDLARAPLPSALHAIRTIGDDSGAYWQPCYDPEGHLILEPGEQLLWTSGGHVDGHSTGRQLPGSVAVTNHRVVWACTGFDKGGGWVGFGVVGLTVATTANVMSKRAAAARSVGKALVGQVRYEWLGSVCEQSIKPSYARFADRRLVLLVPGGSGALSATLHGPAAAEGMPAWVAQVAQAHRLRYRHLLTDEQARLVESMPAVTLGSMGGKDQSWTGWALPGDNALLISAVYNDLASA